MRLNLPAPLVVALGLVGGMLEYLNQTTLHFVPPWNQLITFGLFVIPIFGASPLVGAHFRSALHLSPAVAVTITSLSAALSAAITTFALSGTLKGVLIGIIGFLAFAGFGSTGPVPVVVSPP